MATKDQGNGGLYIKGLALYFSLKLGKMRLVYPLGTKTWVMLHWKFLKWNM